LLTVAASTTRRRIWKRNSPVGGVSRVEIRDYIADIDMNSRIERGGVQAKKDKKEWERRKIWV